MQPSTLELIIGVIPSLIPTSILDLIICLPIFLFIQYLRYFIHELGHIIALHVIKCILRKEYPYALDIHTQVSIHTGRVTSMLHNYLAFANEKQQEYKDTDGTSNQSIPLSEKQKRNWKFLCKNFVLIFYHGPQICYTDFTDEYCYPLARPTIQPKKKSERNPEKKSKKYFYLIRLLYLSGFLLEFMVGICLYCRACLIYPLRLETSFSILESALHLNLLFWILGGLFGFLKKGEGSSSDFKYTCNPNNLEHEYPKEPEKIEPPFSVKNRSITIFWILLMTFLPVHIKNLTIIFAYAYIFIY